MTCKDCVHYEVCNRVEKQIVFTNSSFEEVINSLIKCCRHFKNKADFVEVKKGHWEVCSDEYEICADEFVCSVCKESFVSSELTDEQFLEMMRYCANCGAKMR